MTTENVVYIRSDHARDSDPDEILDGRGQPPEPPDMDTAWRAKVDERLGALERGVELLRESVAGLKFALQGTWVFMAIVAAICWQTLNAVNSARTETLSAVGSLRTEMALTRSEMHTDVSAEVNAIANAVTASKQQVPQVLLVPAPTATTERKPQP